MWRFHFQMCKNLIWVVVSAISQRKYTHFLKIFRADINVHEINSHYIQYSFVLKQVAMWLKMHKLMLFWRQSTHLMAKISCLLWNMNHNTFISLCSTVCMYLSGDQRSRPLCFRRPARWLQPDGPSDPCQSRIRKVGMRSNDSRFIRTRRRTRGLTDTNPLQNQNSSTVSLFIMHFTLKRDPSPTEDTLHIIPHSGTLKGLRSKVRWCHRVLYPASCK